MPRKNCSCSQKCREAVIEKVDIDWLQSEGHPKAKFELKDCPYENHRDNCLYVLEVEWHALIKKPNHMDRYEHKKIKVVLEKDCEFKFDIPKYTNELKIEVNIPLGTKFSKDKCSVCFKGTWKAWDEFGLGFLRYLEGQDLLDVLCVVNCNRMMLDCNRIDHTTSAHHRGPVRSARAHAIVQIAAFDAAVAVKGGFESYTNITPAAQPASLEAAVAQASFDTCKWLYPSHLERLQALYDEMMSVVPDGVAKNNGADAGRRAAQAIIDARVNDGSNHLEQSYIDWHDQHNPNDTIGVWQQDPIAQQPVALGSRWAELVAPFAIDSASTYRAPPFHALNSIEYENEFNEVKSLGGDGVNTYTTRTAEQTIIALFYCYDGARLLGTPPVLYNQLAVQILEDQKYDALNMLRVLALANVAMADAGLSAWETKWHYNIPRPITAIRRAANDGNPNTIGDADWTPLGAPSSNSNNVNGVPPFAAYVSGHSTFGSALFQILRKEFGTDEVPFTFVSDELNGVTTDNQGNVRPFTPRSFRTLSQAEFENGYSRILLGIHWKADMNAGAVMGRSVADDVYANYFRAL